MTSSPTTKSTTSRTAKTTAMARTTTEAGIGVSRAQPMILQSEKLRNRQVKNFLTVTMLSLGLPMILMGDKVRRTQQGNNNAYCQDNETSWFDWTLVAKHADVHRLVRLLSARRLLRDEEPERQRLSLNQVLRKANKAWHGVKLGQPDWSVSSHSLAFSV